MRSCRCRRIDGLGRYQTLPQCEAFIQVRQAFQPERMALSSLTEQPFPIQPSDVGPRETEEMTLLTPTESAWKG
jgi:hypothetical protein